MKEQDKMLTFTSSYLMFKILKIKRNDVIEKLLVLESKPAKNFWCCSVILSEIEKADRLLDVYVS